MASMALIAAASYMGNSLTIAAAKQLPTTVRRGIVAVRASSTESEKMVVKEESKGRRELVLGVTAAAAAALCSAAVAVAEEPGRGTADARKKYSPVCVTMPTARICHK